MSTRREFLTSTLVGGAAAALAPRRAGAAPKSMSVVHESSFIKPFDDFFVKKLAAGVREAHGHQDHLRAGQRGQHAHPADDHRRDQVRPRDHRHRRQLAATSSTRAWSTSPTSRTEIGKKLGALARQRPRRRGGQQEVEGAALGQHRPARGVSHRLVQGGRRHQVPRQLGRPARRRPPAQEERPSVRLRARPRLRRQPRLALPAALVLRRPRGGQGRQDGPHRLQPRRPQAVDFCRRFYKETMFEDVLGWTDVNNNKAFFGEQISCTNNASSILVVGKRDFPEIAKVTDHALNPQGPKGRFHIFNPQSHAILTHAPTRRRPRPSCAGSTTTSSSRAGSPPATRTTRRSSTATTTTRCGTPSRATCRTRSRSRPRACTGGLGPPGHAMSESVAKYVVVDMFAKACRGDVDQGRHRHRRPPSSSRSTKRSSRWPSGRHRSPGRPRSPAGRCSLRGLLEREGVFSWLMLAPGVLFLLAFVAYPFFYGIFLSLQDRPVAKPGVFIGLGNFVTLAHDAGVLAGRPATCSSTRSSPRS